MRLEGNSVDELVKQLVSIEEKAKRIVEEARDEADELRRSAEEDLRNMEIEAIHQAKLQGQKKIEEQLRKAEETSKKILAGAQMEVVQMEQKYHAVKKEIKEQLFNSIFTS